MAAEIGVIPGGGQPYGDIYNTGMPDTQAAQEQETGMRGKMLLMQQREQQAQKQAKLKEAQGQQDAINAKVRGADAPLVMQKYNDFRAASMDLDKNSKNLPREELLSRQQQVNQKLGDLNKLINDSVQRKSVEGEMLKQQADPNNAYKFNNDASNYLSQSIKMPIDKLNSFTPTDENGKPIVDTATNKPKVLDLTDPSLYNYKPTTDFTKVISDATGNGDNKLTGGIVVGNPNSINRTENNFTGINSPYAISQTLASSIPVDDEKNKIKAVDRVHDYKAQHQNISDADIAATDKQYNEQYLANPNVKAAYGFKGDEQFAKTGDAALDKYIKYDAQKQAILHPPVNNAKITTNEAAKTAEDHNFDIYKMNYADKLKKGDEVAAGKTVDEGFNSMISGNGNIQQSRTLNTNGSSSVEERKEISAPLDFRKAFAANVGAKKAVNPDAIVVRPNGILTGVYYKRDNDGNIMKDANGENVKRLDVTPVEMDPNTAKVAYAKATGGTKAVEALSKYNNAPKAFNKSDLLSKGWSESQIKQAVKAGKIKVQ